MHVNFFNSGIKVVVAMLTEIVKMLQNISILRQLKNYSSTLMNWWQSADYSHVFFLTVT